MIRIDKFGGRQWSGIHNVVGERVTLRDDAENGMVGYGVVCTGTLVGAEGTGAGQAKIVDGRTEVSCWLVWLKMQAN